MTETVSTKVKLLTAISHAWLELKNEVISPQEFDYLYDQDEEYLAYLLGNLNVRIDMVKKLEGILKVLEQAFSNENRPLHP
jgi:hypothetical protein